MKWLLVLVSTIFSLISVAAADAGVPAQYTAIDAGQRQFSCLGRTIQLDDFLLPSQVIAANGPVLASAMRITSEPPIALSTSKSRLVSNSGASAKWEWSGDGPDFRASAAMTADCDGFCWYEIRLEPKHPARLSSLRLEIPRIAPTARYLHTANFTWSNVSGGLPEIGGKWS